MQFTIYITIHGPTMNKTYRHSLAILLNLWHGTKFISISLHVDLNWICSPDRVIIISDRAGIQFKGNIIGREDRVSL